MDQFDERLRQNLKPQQCVIVSKLNFQMKASL